MNQTTNKINSSKYLTEYTNYMTEQNKSTNTINSYVKDINLFFEYFNLAVDESPIITRDQIIEYKDYMLKVKNMNAKSVNRGLSSLKSYNEFMILKGYMENLVILSQHYISIQKTSMSPTKTSMKEMNKFMDKVKQNEVARNYYIVRLLLNTGLRVSELTNIKLTDIYLNKKKLRVIGKGYKQREIPLNEKAIEIIELAIKDRENYNYALNILDSKYLFLSKKSEKLDTGTIERIFNKYSNIITPHSCRHCFATNFLENGGRIDVLQMILGHSDPSTTMIYNHPSQTRIMESVNNCCI